MSPEERQLLTGLFDRVRTQAGQTRDREAETFISDAVRTQPYAPYLLAQTVIVQEQALRAANDRLGELEARVHELEAQGSKGSGGFLGGLFGGGASSSAPPRSMPQSMAPPPGQQGGPWGGQPGGGWAGQPQQQSGPWAQQQPPGAPGGGFLKGALGAAAGVAGGVLLADSIRGLFHGGGSNSLGIGSGFGGGLGGGGATTVNNYYGNDADDGGYTAAGGSGNSGGDGFVSDADYASDSGSSFDSDDGGYNT